MPYTEEELDKILRTFRRDQKDIPCLKCEYLGFQGYMLSEYICDHPTAIEIVNGSFYRRAISQNCLIVHPKWCPLFTTPDKNMFPS